MTRYISVKRLEVWHQEKLGRPRFFIYGLTKLEAPPGIEYY